MQKIEYKLVLKEKFYATMHHTKAQKEEDWLNELGKDGWELFYYQNLNSDNDLYKFKRIINPS